MLRFNLIVAGLVWLVLDLVTSRPGRPAAEAVASAAFGLALVIVGACARPDKKQ